MPRAAPSRWRSLTHSTLHGVADGDGPGTTTSHHTPNGSGSPVGTSPRYAAITPSVSKSRTPRSGSREVTAQRPTLRVRRPRRRQPGLATEPAVLVVGLDAVDADRHAETAAVDAPVTPAARSVRPAMRSRRAMRRPRVPGRTVAVALGPRDAERLPARAGEHLAPRPLDDAARRRAGRRSSSRRSQRDVTLDDRAVGKTKHQARALDRGADGEERGHRFAFTSAPSSSTR